MKRGGSIAVKSLETFFARLAVQILAVLGGIVVARELGAGGKGLYTYVVTVTGTVQMLWAGQSAAVLWQYGKRHLDARAVFRAAMPILLTGIVLGTAAVAGIALGLPQQRVLFAAAAALPFALFVQLSTGFFLADADVRTLNVQQAISGALPVVVYVPVLLFARGTLVTVLAAWAGAWFAAGLFSWIRVKRAMRNAPNSSEGEPRNLMREQAAYGLQMSFNSVVSYLNFRIDVFLVLFILGQQALGVYSIGISIGELLFNITRPIVTSATGRIAHNDERESAQVTATCMRHSFALVLLCSVVVYFAAPPLIVLVYGPQFAGAGIVLRYLLPGIIAYSTMPVLATFFSQQLGNPRIPLALSTISMVLCAGITAAILPVMGIAGGAIATSVSYFTAFAFAVAYFMRRTGMPLRRMFVLSADDLHSYRRVALLALAWPGTLKARLSGR